VSQRASYRLFLRVIYVHIGVILLFSCFSLVKSCRIHRTNPEVVTYVEWAPSAPPPARPAPIVSKKDAPAEPMEQAKAWTPTQPSEIKKGKRITSLSPKAVDRESQDRKKLLEELKAKKGKADAFHDYEATITRLLYANWQPPQGEQTRRSGTVVRLEMNRQGRIRDCRCVTSSGSVGYDETVMQAVRAVQTLPAPPAGYPTTSIEIEFIRMEK
jgi:TonB family protein